MTRSEDRTIELDDGRTLAFVDFGNEDDTPVFFFHGSPGSRAHSETTKRIAERAGVRVIAPDRPGYGDSDMDHGRTLLDWTEDVATLADSLEIGRFAVVGKSAGGPHAAACAHALGDRVPFAAFCSSPAPRSLPGAKTAYDLFERTILRVAANAQPVIDTATTVLAKAFKWDEETYFDKLEAQLCPADCDLLRDEKKRKELAENYRLAYKQGSEGHTRDFALMLEEWGFEPSEIAIPTLVWHGTDDTVVPPEMAKILADALPKSQRRMFDGLGHFVVERDDYWEELLRHIAGAARE